MAYSRDQILELLYHQLDNFFFLSKTERQDIAEVINSVLERCRINFQASDNKYFKANGGGITPSTQ